MPSAPPFELEAIDHVLLLVGGLDESLAFYRDVFGADVAARFPKYAMAELRAGSSQIDLVDVCVPEGAWAKPSTAGGRNVDHIALRIGTVCEQALREHLAAHGVAIVEERRDENAGGKTLSFYVRDPSGNTIELFGRV